MKDRLELKIDAALNEIVNAPASPHGALVAGVRARAARRASRQSRTAALWAAAAALVLNACLAALLVFRDVKLFGGGWGNVAVFAAGLMLAMLPAVLLLSLGELLKTSANKKRNIGVI